ncbi:Crp/Fnr family transcriptional regulator [Bradyrhizobium sp. 482_C4_N1_1]|uniref:Crp/Fnr family transcriptional regulator n=1 Tax=unclassified Bradyrhizobium TaxID=2631580 RepID=UPI0033919700
MAFAKFDLLQWMPPDLRTVFLNRLQRRQYRPGQSIYVQGSPGVEMFRLASGTVRISVLRPDGRQITYTLFEPGDCFGQTSLIDEGARPQTTEASSDVEVGVLSRSAFLELSSQFPSFDKAIMRLLAAQLRVLAQNYEGASLDDLNIRVARQILQACAVEEAGAPGSSKLLSARLSQAQLASMVGASRQSVNKVLQKLRHQGMIQIDYGRVLVMNMSGLKKMILRKSKRTL